MRIVVTGGGTAGHVTPLLAVAYKLKSLDANNEIIYIAQKGDKLSAELVNDKVFDEVYFINAGKLRRYHGKSLAWYLTQPDLIYNNIKDFGKFGVGLAESYKILKRLKPDVVFVKGGFVGLPVGLAAAKMGVPLVTHDSDVLPGLTNRILSKYASAMAVGMPTENYPQYAAKPLFYTGVPIKKEYQESYDAKATLEKLGLSTVRFTIAIVGGSLGAVRVNNAIYKALPELLKDNKTQLIWLTGQQQFEDLKAMLAKEIQLKSIWMGSFSHELPQIMSAADLIITRAGATTLAEIAALAKPSIIVPNPLLTGGHQTKNAKILAKQNAAIVVAESELDNGSNALINAVELIKNDRSKQKELSENIAKNAHDDAAEEIARLITKVAKDKI